MTKDKDRAAFEKWSREECGTICEARRKAWQARAALDTSDELVEDIKRILMIRGEDDYEVYIACNQALAQHKQKGKP